MAQMVQMVWLISSFEPISGFRTGSDIDDGIPLRRFLVRHAIVILAPCMVLDFDIDMVYLAF